LSLQGFFQRRDRNPDDLVIAKDSTRRSALHIGLAKMNAVGAAGQRNIDPVVYDEWDSKL
jgi:hypothetical protein